MKVKALTNIKCGDGWHMAGETFEIREDAYGDLNGLVEKTEQSVSPQPPEGTLPEEAKPKRATARKRKE